jgi:hypothetical protein
LAAVKYDDVLFVHTFNAKSREEHNTRVGQIVLFKQFDERRNNFDIMNTTISINALDQFLAVYSYADLMEYDDRAAARVFEKKNPAIFLFTDHTSE